MPKDYDVIVIGAGAVGENVADIAARDGLRVAIVERDLVGGECTYWACMPSKALLRPGEALAAARRVPGAAEAVVGTLDVAAALGRRDALASHWDDAGHVEWLESVGVDLIRGHGRLAGERLVEVEAADGTRATHEAAKAVVIATGSAADFPPIDGLDEVKVWDSRDATTLEEVPKRLLVIGGGAVGVEMAQAWKWLGSEEVTVVELFDQLLSREEPFAGEELAEALGRMGIRVLTLAETTRLERAGSDGPVRATVRVGDGIEVIQADEVLVATGRRPRTGDVGLDTVGLEPGQWLEVDDHLRVEGVDGGWLYAAGDVNNRSLLTHTGKYQGRIAGAHINGRDSRAWGDAKAVPRVVFTDPQIAAVGLLEEQARRAGIDVRTVRYDIRRVAGAATLGRGHRGTCQLVVDAERRVVVGATFVGPHAGELLHAATVAIVGEVTLDRLWHAIPSFPTLSEVWLRLLEAYRDEYGEAFD